MSKQEPTEGLNLSTPQLQREDEEGTAETPAEANANGEVVPVDSDGVTSCPGEKDALYRRAWRRWRDFYEAQSFLVLMAASIALAYAYPPLGADYLQPQITATYVAVIFIFVMSGLSLKTAEFSKALQHLGFNLFVQVFNFGVVSIVVFGFTRFMEAVGALTSSLADGMVICSCLSLTINSVIVLTKSSGGDEAAAVFNTAFGNMIGVFLTPVLITAYIGVRGGVALGDVFLKLAMRVLLPIVVGQLLQKLSNTVVTFVDKYKKHFKQGQEYCLLFIVYAVFCETFVDGTDATIGDAFLMIACQGLLLAFVMVLAWYALKLAFPTKPKLRVMGLFGCTHKTMAIGVPLINSIYGNDPLVGIYILPLLVWHPLQLLIGSAIAPKLFDFVENEVKRLGNETLSTDVTFDEETITATGDEEIETIYRP